MKNLFGNEIKQSSKKLRVIYRPSGRAAEYCPFALNIFTGCEHGCIYCYVPSTLRITPTGFQHEVKPRQHILQNVQHDCALLPPQSLIHLCFTCDPYPPIEKQVMVTRKIICLLHQYGLFVQILTKAGFRAMRDFDLLTKQDKFGVTLTFWNPHDSAKWEPHASPPAERIASLYQAKQHDITTWVSLEPVIDPAQTLRLIQESAEFVDEFRVGKLNHHPLARQIDWHQFAIQAIDLLTKLGKKYYIKNDLRHYLA